jgi:hypothetical protein
VHSSILVNNTHDAAAMTSVANANSGQALTPPRGAAIAGVIFSVLMIAGLGLARYAIPADLTLPGWLMEPDRRKAVRFALDLIPFAGIAFLWFIGVIRNRLGELEDRFFATVFLGSGLLFVACLFGVAAVMGATIDSVAAGKFTADTYYLAQRISDTLFNLFAMKMAGVFMVSTCTMGSRTGIMPRWIALVGYACALVLLLVIASSKWITLVFPGWMLLLISHVLLSGVRCQPAWTVKAGHSRS